MTRGGGEWIPSKSDDVIYEEPLNEFTASDFTLPVRRPNQTLSSLTDIFQIYLCQVLKKTYCIRFEGDTSRKTSISGSNEANSAKKGN